MFLDEKTVSVGAGKGGDGAILFRREIYVPKGGPDGGDGGNGGDVFVEGQRNLHALTHLARTDRIDAEDGKSGSHQRSTGKSGEDATIAVPLGTVIFRITENEEEKLGEIIEEGQRIRIAKGGNGGWGNWRFRSSVQQAPHHANPGQPGEKYTIRLVLKLIADVGLVGLPNAGKSTLLSVISAAHPKIADYPFTTLEPQLGVAEIGKGEDRRQIVVADLPGLIEGASQGKGLGTTFLKHIERTKLLLHCLDCSQETEGLLKSYYGIRHELESWSETLAAKPEILVLTKTDIISAEDLAKKKEALSKKLGKTVVSISAATHQGLLELLTLC